jgi:hypothetical protein
MKATKPDIIRAAANVVEAQQAYEKALASGDGTEQRYLDHMQSCILRLKWLIERDRPSIAARFKESA